MSGFNDVGDYLLNNGGVTSESEGEMDGEHNQIDLPQSMPGRGNVKSQQSAIRLHELGPRLALQLVKIEEGLYGWMLIRKENYQCYINYTLKLRMAGFSRAVGSGR